MLKLAICDWLKNTYLFVCKHTNINAMLYHIQFLIFHATWRLVCEYVVTENDKYNSTFSKVKCHWFKLFIISKVNLI